MTQAVEIRDASVAADEKPMDAFSGGDAGGRGAARGRPVPLHPGFQDGGSR